MVCEVDSCHHCRGPAIAMLDLAYECRSCESIANHVFVAQIDCSILDVKLGAIKWYLRHSKLVSGVNGLVIKCLVVNITI